MISSGCQSMIRDLTWSEAQWREYRIEENLDFFDSLALDIQEKIRAGKIEMGFSPAQCSLSVGKPSKVYKKRTVSESLIVWEYIRTKRKSEYKTVHYDTTYVDHKGRLRTKIETAHVDVDHYEDIVTRRLTFSEDKLIEDEQLQ